MEQVEFLRLIVTSLFMDQQNMNLNHFSILMWNLQGAASRNFLFTLKEFIRKHDQKILILVETKVSGDTIDDVCHRINFDGTFRAKAVGFRVGQVVRPGPGLAVPHSDCAVGPGLRAIVGQSLFVSAHSHRTRVSIHLSCAGRLTSPIPACSAACAFSSTAPSAPSATTMTSIVRRIPDELETFRFIVPKFATMFAGNSLLLL
ncbi:hypothetical protein Cgig2_010388 [Carnegiea gigantea]|uniref:Uncharacterized protein n=1 Tax=Carnegiea gigantea TaxID=171969 RepID=A0A9Q1K821_9CARY|nr:hypothetical protein Cgig2_010388 [Carnegiea gigantea]